MRTVIADQRQEDEESGGRRILEGNRGKTGRQGTRSSNN